MTNKDDKLAQAIRKEFPAEQDAPSFDETWAAAESRYRGARRRYAGFGAVAAAAAVVVVMTLGGGPQPTGPVVDMDQLLSSTSWTAPSDVLLPQREFDIYQDLPTLPVSTKSAEGALL